MKLEMKNHIVVFKNRTYQLLLSKCTLNFLILLRILRALKRCVRERDFEHVTYASARLSRPTTLMHPTPAKLAWDMNTISENYFRASYLLCS